METRMIFFIAYLRGCWSISIQHNTMRQLTLSTGLRLCKVRSDGGVDALLNILDNEEDLWPDGPSPREAEEPSVCLFPCDHAKWINTEKCGRTHGPLCPTNINGGGRKRNCLCVVRPL